MFVENASGRTAYSQRLSACELPELERKHYINTARERNECRTKMSVFTASATIAFKDFPMRCSRTRHHACALGRVQEGLEQTLQQRRHSSFSLPLQCYIGVRGAEFAGRHQHGLLYFLGQKAVGIRHQLKILV